MSVYRLDLPHATLHIPRRTRIDWLAALVWCVLVPVSGAMGWYGLWRLIAWLIHL